MHYGPLSKACARVTTPAVVRWAMYTSHVEFENIGGLWLRGRSVNCCQVWSEVCNGLGPRGLSLSCGHGDGKA